MGPCSSFPSGEQLAHTPPRGPAAPAGTIPRCAPGHHSTLHPWAPARPLRVSAALGVPRGSSRVCPGGISAQT